MATNVVQLRDVPSVRDGVSEAEWQALVDLAAAYRLAHEYRWADSIFPYFHVRAGRAGFFLIKAHELLYNEVSASKLVKVYMRLEDVDEAAGLHPTWRAVVGAPGRELFLSHPHSRLHCRRQPDVRPVAGIANRHDLHIPDRLPQL
jgi:ribulose-5-phosphate 4-epimerase/fuculose-1-phosphate aldolase